MTIASSSDVFFDQLKDLRSAVVQIAASWPDLIGWAEETSLRSLLEEHQAATDHSLLALKAIFDAHSVDSGDDPSLAIAGLVKGGNKHLKMAADATVRDHLLIAHTRRIAAYLEAAAEFTAAIGKRLSLEPEVEAVREILAFEKEFIRRLQIVAMESLGLELGGEEA